VTGYFLLPGAIDVPYVYRIRRIRDGGMYSLRGVDVFQNSDAAANGQTPCFAATVSFKRSEQGSQKWAEYEYQNVAKDHIETKYRKVLEGLRPEDHPLAPGADALWWEREEAESWIRDAAAFPGVETRKVDMAKHNGKVEPGGGSDGEGTARYRQLLFYRLIQDNDLSEKGEAEIDLNLHAAAHLYASDKNSLFLVQRALGYETVRTTMASLSHTVVFHGPAAHLSMVDEDGKSKWFVQEAWTSNGGDNRGCHNSLLWNFDTGRLVGTTIQDGMLRFPAGAVETVKTKEKGLRAGRKIDSKL
jgi:acyl-CoA thioesterase